MGEKKLLIVESPAKAKTIGKYLGADFVVKSSVGHVRDLPKESKAISIVEKGPERWEFVPTYVVSEGKTKVVSELKSAVKSASEIYLASDPDREGEAIAWHLREVLAQAAGSKPFRRVTYNEITKSAVLKAVASPREIDMPLVDAQQARRILDRIVGYKVSPLLWKNISCAKSRTLSAGRVQSVALRLLVERQREIDAFKPETYFLMGAEARKQGEAKTFAARLSRIDGKKPDIRDRDLANSLLLDLSGATLKVADVKRQPKMRHTQPPFTTSTLQQAASSVLGFSPGKTMGLAQSLYEQGHITYMRTDSVNVSEQARAAAKDFIVSQYGAEFYPESPNFFKSKADAQGAHEAIRPTDVQLTPQNASSLDPAELKLYDLIWRRFVASQMADARTTLTTLSIGAEKQAITHAYVFTSSATTVNFEGFLRVMKLSLRKKAEEAEDDDSDEVAYLPDVTVGETLQVVRWLSDEKQTKGPAHYSEASLIKALEENGVGRPSTYATTIETLKVRQYAKAEKRKLVPLERGVLVCDWLVKNMDALFNVGFTAQMEGELDKVEERGVPMNDMLSAFYSRFLASLPPPPRPPDTEKFEIVLHLLSQVRNWKEPKKIGRRIYDDCKFVESCKEQFEKGEKEMSARQLEFLVKLCVIYADQIQGCEKTLKDVGLWPGSTSAQKASPSLVKYCFGVLDRIGGMEHNQFINSLREQYERTGTLTMRQFAVLAKTVGECSKSLDDVEDVRAKLAQFVPGGFELPQVNPAIAGILELLNDISEWRPPTKLGKKLYNDQGFVASLAEQFARRHTLSSRQVAVLKRVANAYRAQIPNYEQRMADIDRRLAAGDKAE